MLCCFNLNLLKLWLKFFPQRFIFLCNLIIQITDRFWKSIISHLNLNFFLTLEFSLVRIIVECKLKLRVICKWWIMQLMIIRMYSPFNQLESFFQWIQSLNKNAFCILRRLYLIGHWKSIFELLIDSFKNLLLHFKL